LRRGLLTLGAILCAGVVAAACSSSPGSHTATGTTSSHKNSSTTTSTTSTTVVTPTTASTTTTTGIEPCAQVTATPGQGQGAAGTIVGTITLAEVGTGTCTIDGYPTLARFGASGASVPVTVVDGLTVNLSGPPSEPASVVTLTPGQQAEFTFQYSDVPTGSETTCASSTTLSVTTPGATSASAPAPLIMAPCTNGTVNVSPVYAATAS
jgi:Protein of unknown function (DUF4232)